MNFRQSLHDAIFIKKFSRKMLLFEKVISGFVKNLQIFCYQLALGAIPISLITASLLPFFDPREHRIL